MTVQHKHKRHEHKPACKRRIPAFIAIGVLLIITIGASLSAFVWLGSVKEHIELPSQVLIESVYYNRESNEMNIELLNGLSGDLQIRTQGKVTEQTIFTIYPPDASSIGCNYIPLSKLGCDSDKGVCDGNITSGQRASINLAGTRRECLITGAAGDPYHLDIRFGNKAESEADFVSE